MTYRVQYHASSVEAPTLEAAIEYAKSMIVEDAGEMAAWRIEHDDVVNDWFVQGTPDGSLQYTATVAGPEPVPDLDDAVPAQPAEVYPGRPARPTRPDEDGAVVRCRSFAGGLPAEVFGQATAWLAAAGDSVELLDLGWHQLADGAAPLDLRVYYRLR
jgi:hypothetical protein